MDLTKIGTSSERARVARSLAGVLLRGAALARVCLCWLCVRFRTARVASCHGRDRNMPIKILDTRIELLGRGEDVAASVEGEKDGGMDVKWNRDVGGTISGDIESQQRGWLQKVSIWVIMQDRDETTHQCRPSHPQTL